MRENTSGNNNSFSKKVNRCRSFHFRYLELCRAKNYSPITEIKSKNNATSVLDFFGDKLKVDDWLFIIESLHYDQILQHLAIRLRKNIGDVVDHIDTERKAKFFKQKPAIYTKYVFTGVVDAIANCIQFDKNLVVLQLEALPLTEKFVVTIAKALSTAEQLKQISFERSPIGDNGCEAICSTIKYLASVETINMSECNFTVQAASHIADMIKFQKICRYSDGWQKSLRYRDVDPNTMPGLRVILIARNPNITDDGVSRIVDVLKEDAWIKTIDMENCGITDTGANLILDCLEVNSTIIEYNIRNNPEVSKFLQKNIRQQLGKDEENSSEPDSNKSFKKAKISITHLKERLKFLEEQIASEKNLRKQVELLNEKLHKQIISYKSQLNENASAVIPDGYVLVKNDSLESIIKERNDLYKAVAVARLSKSKGYLKRITNVRKVKSEVKYKQTTTNNTVSKSNYEFGTSVDNRPPISRPNVEKNIGDYKHNQLTARVGNVKQPLIENRHTSTNLQLDLSDTEEMKGSLQQIKVFIKKKQNREEDCCPSSRSALCL